MSTNFISSMMHDSWYGSTKGKETSRGIMKQAKFLLSLMRRAFLLMTLPVSLQYILFFTPRQFSKRQIASGFGGYLHIVKIFSNEAWRKKFKTIAIFLLLRILLVLCKPRFLLLRGQGFKYGVGNPQLTLTITGNEFETIGLGAAFVESVHVICENFANF